MKNLKFFTAFALVALLSSPTIGATPTGLYDVIFGAATTSISVEATNVSNQTMTVQILNENEEYIVNEQFKNKADFIKKYDLVNMKDGEYQLIITKQDRRITQPFGVDGGYVQLSELEKKTTYFPTFKLRKNHLDVSVFSEKYGDIVVKFFDENDEIAYTDKNVDVNILLKRYDLKKLSNGTYKVEMIVNGESFFYDFKK